MDMNLQGKIVIVTGASRGIGKATVALFRKKGATVIGCSRGTDTDFQCDVSNDDQVHALFKQVQHTYGQLDILVNNAGVLRTGEFMSQSLSDWDDQYHVNVRGLVHCTQHAFKLMNTHGGSIVNVSSLAGVQNVEKFPGFSSYVASKSAVSGLTEALAAEGKPLNIRVNAVAPGAVATQMLREWDASFKTSTQPEDIAKIILFLADAQQSNKLTGCIMPVYCND
jgi:NAD(P)-dependent dehydrogenase (short-subunit alcohol dehydrogenase family)